jgi:small multidrug resistance pump
MSVFLFSIAIIFQIGMVSLLPMTRGFTAIVPTLGCLSCISIALFCLSRLIHDGVSLSFLTPLSSATVPLAAIAIAALVYGEPVPVLKLVLLFGACGLIGAASAIR